MSGALGIASRSLFICLFLVSNVALLLLCDGGNIVPAVYAAAPKNQKLTERNNIFGGGDDGGFPIESRDCPFGHRFIRGECLLVLTS